MRNQALQWKHISFEERRLSVRRSKTRLVGGDPPLNKACLEALRELHTRAAELGFTEPEHFLFVWHGRDKKLDPSRPMSSGRTAWRSLREAAGLTHVRFHDGRHSALTRLAEKGVADWVIRAQFGHVSPAMMAIYSHVRRKALNEAAAALEPEAAPSPPPNEPATSAEGVTSQSAPTRRNVLEPQWIFGSSGWTRTSNPPVNRLAQVHYLIDSSCL